MKVNPYTEKQKASLRQKAKKNGYMVQWKPGEMINSQWRIWNDDDLDFSVTDGNFFNLYRVVKIK